MILYFSGTGNSLYIAKKVAEAFNERIISIADLVCREQYELTVKNNETIGFVFPVIACAPPDIVTKFIKKISFKGYDGNYIYSIYNCAGTPEYTSRIMKETAEKRGFTINGFYGILMPGNYITQKKHLPEEIVKKYLLECDEHIKQVVEDINQRKCNYKKEKHSFVLSYGLHKLAVLEKTEKFIFGDDCIQCGKCVAICPMNAISMNAEKPIRNQKKCEFCLACVNVCPTRALQVGRKTQGNPQYINPYYNGKAREQA